MSGDGPDPGLSLAIAAARPARTGRHGWREAGHGGEAEGTGGHGGHGGGHHWGGHHYGGYAHTGGHTYHPGYRSYNRGYSNGSYYGGYSSYWPYSYGSGYGYSYPSTGYATTNGQPYLDVVHVRARRGYRYPLPTTILIHGPA